MTSEEFQLFERMEQLLTTISSDLCEIKAAQPSNRQRHDGSGSTDSERTIQLLEGIAYKLNASPRR